MPQDKIETYNLTAILENMLDSVWTINKAYEVVYLNTVFENAFFSAFGIHLKKGATILEKMPAQLALIWKERYDKALANERLIIEDKIDFGAAFVFIEVRLNPIVVENKVVGVSIISRDITQRNAGRQKKR